jgi:hypothetical protein
MKKLILLTTLIAIALSSCLKDSATTVNFSKAGNIVNFPQSGTPFFNNDAITSDTAVIQFATDYATASSNSALSVTLAVDQTITTAYNTANAKVSGITYLPMPASAYKLSSTTVSIGAGAQYAFTTLTVYKNTLDPTLSYMLPIKIASASGVPISANQSIHYYHVIGNDFAGAYKQTFQRYNAADTTVALNSASFIAQPVTILPVSPTEFTVTSGYASNVYDYDVTYTKTGTGATAMYSNLAVSFTAASIAAGTASSISVTSNPVFLPYPGLISAATPNPSGEFTFAQVEKILHFEYGAMTSAPRTLVDTYFK